MHKDHQGIDLNRRLRSVAAILLLTGSSPMFVGCRRENDLEKQIPQRPPAQVTAVTATIDDVPIYLEEIGKVVAVEIVSIVPQVGGKIVAAHVEDGAYVLKGQLLFEIDPRPFQAAVESAEATLNQSKADLELARIEFKRVQELASQGAAKPIEYDQDRVALAVAEAKVAGAEAATQTARLNLEYTRIYSPIDGRAGARRVDPGNVVKANDEPLQVIRRLDPIYAEFTITENDLGTVRKYMAARGLEWGDSPERGLRVEVDLPGDSRRVLTALGAPVPPAAPDANRAGPRVGNLTFLDNEVQSGTGTVKLRATVANADHYFWPGQFVNVRLVLSTKKDAVLVPAQAQQIGQQGAYVYVVRPDSTAELRVITPGQRQGDLIVIEQGLRSGEEVVVTGQMSVTPDGQVRVTNKVAGVALPAAAGGAAVQTTP